MTETTAARALDTIITGTDMIGPGMIARAIQHDGVTGVRDSYCDSPVGNWVISRMRARGIPADTYAWVETFEVYDISGDLIAASHLTHGVLHGLECRINEGAHPELTSEVAGFAQVTGVP